MSGKNSGEARPTTEYGTSQGLFGETDRESGEYHFRNGYTQQVYSNAHFVPVDESTSPPKYYRPSKTSGDSSGTHKARGKASGSGFAAVLLLCFLSGIIGGVIGAYAFTHWQKNDTRAMNASETLDDSYNDGGNASEQLLAMGEAAGSNSDDSESELTAADIYDLACTQVVSVAVETLGTVRR